jgi:integrase
MTSSTAGILAIPVKGPSPFEVDWPAWELWLRGRVDPGWRAGEWEEQWWLFTGSAENPQTSVWKCSTPTCISGLYSRRGRCAPCVRDHQASGLDLEEFDRTYVPERRTRDGADQGDCILTRDGIRCGRAAASSTGLCEAHGHYLYQRRRAGHDVPAPKLWALAGPGGRPYPVPPQCVVGGCENKSRHEAAPLCTYHLETWEHRDGGRRTDRAATLAWAAGQAPALGAWRFSLIGLSPLTRLEVSYGLQKRDELGHRLDPRAVRKVASALAASGSRSLLLRDEQLTRLFDTKDNPGAFFRQVAWSVRRGYVECSGTDPWSENSIDLRAAGLKSRGRTGARRVPGLADLSVIPQPWLRDLLRRHTEAVRPTSNAFSRALRVTTLAAAGMNRLPGGGMDLTQLEFSHMQAAFDEIAGDRRRDGKLCGAGFRADLLTGFFQLLDFGRFTGLLDNVPGSFARHPSHRIAAEEANEEELGKAIPEPVIAQLDVQVGSISAGVTYGELTEDQVREMFACVYVVLRDTGRRPKEVASLPVGCLEHDGDEVSLIWHNHKGHRMRRRLPIVRATVAAIERWQEVRARTSAPATSTDYLFPAISPDSGFKHLDTAVLSVTLRRWVDALPELHSDVIGADGNPVPFDRSLIFPYAFRHSFAQRHADAGTPLDVLQDLMDHDDPSTTTGYYQVTLKRKREAVKTLSRQVADRFGLAKPCSQAAYEQRSVAVPFGGCIEPSNIKAGGGHCPIRFQCAGCGHYRPDPSYLPTIEDHINTLRAERETARALDAADFVTANLSAQIDAYTGVATTMRERLAGMPEAERTEMEEAAAILRRLRAGAGRKTLPVSVINRGAS